jgi:alpha-N-arabinofuranosidase
MLIGGRGIIDAEIGGDAWETFHYYILQHAILYGNGTLLDSALVCNRYDTKQFEGVPVMDSVAVLDEKNNRLTIFAVNRTREEINLNMNLQGFNEFKKWDHILMCSDDVYGQNTADNRYAIVPKLCANTRFDDNGILSRLQPYSWNVINFYN